MWFWNFLIFAGSLALLWKTRTLRSDLDWIVSRSERSIKSLHALVSPESAPTAKSGDTPQIRVAIEVLDPLELAKSQSVLARIFSSIVPGIVKQQTYARVVAEAKADLKRKGVKAKVSVIEL